MLKTDNRPKNSKYQYKKKSSQFTKPCILAELKQQISQKMIIPFQSSEFWRCDLEVTSSFVNQSSIYIGYFSIALVS